MTCKDLRQAKTVEQVSDYVQRFTRYSKDSRTAKYYVNYPTNYGSRFAFSNDTWDLVVKLCKLFDIEVKDEEC